MIAKIYTATPQARAAVEFGCMMYGLDVEQTGPTTATIYYQDEEKAARVLTQYPAEILAVFA